METSKNLTVLHCIFYIYHTFAFSSDGNLTPEEKKTISNFMYRWVGKDQEKMTKIINETLMWSKSNIKSINDQIGAMISMVDFLKTQTDFSIDRREYFLMDIRNIARSEGNFLDQQKKWHDMMAKSLEVEIRISPQSFDQIETSLKNVKKKKIGFRRDKD